MRISSLGFLIALGASAQTRYDSQVTTAQTNVSFGAYAPVLTVPHASVRVCQYPVILNPCTVAIVYGDAGLTSVLQNPIVADGMGFYGFWAPAGTYVIQPSSGNLILTPKTVTLGGGGAGVPGPIGPQGIQGPAVAQGPAGSGANITGTPNALVSIQSSGTGFASTPFTTSSPSSGIQVLNFAPPGLGTPDTVFTQYYHSLYGGPISEFPGTLKADAAIFSPYLNIGANNLASGSSSYAAIFSNNQTTTPGFNHGTSSAETHTPFVWQYANAYASGFRSPFGFAVTDFAADGDEQVFDFSYLDRPGCIDPSCEGHHRWRTEHQSVLPYYGNVASSGTDGNGHPYLNLTPQYNPQTLTASLPLLDVTALRSDTVSLVTPSGGGNLSTSILTVGGTYTASTSYPRSAPGLLR